MSTGANWEEMGEQDELGDVSDGGAMSEHRSICPKCGSGREWESVFDRAKGVERWFSICECGYMDAVVPREGRLATVTDPLRTYLAGSAQPGFSGTPPWIRLFLHTTQQSPPIRWRYDCQACPGCGVEGGMRMQAYPHLDLHGSCALCLSCGYVTASYASATRDTISHLGGADWTPACPAVMRLRDCALRPYKALYINGWGSPPGAAFSDDDWDSFFGQWKPFT